MTQLVLKSSRTFLAIKDSWGTKIGKVIEALGSTKLVIKVVTYLWLMGYSCFNSLTAIKVPAGMKKPSCPIVLYCRNSTKSTANHQHNSTTKNHHNGDPFAPPMPWWLELYPKSVFSVSIRSVFLRYYQYYRWKIRSSVLSVLRTYKST